MTTAPDANAAFGDLCRSLWLIVYGHGPASEKLASEVAAQCDAVRIRCRVCPIDDRASIELHRYQGLVVILPTYSPDLRIRGALEPFAHLVTDYRARWGDGLAAVHAGKIPAYEAGPISLVGQRVLDPQPHDAKLAAPLLRRASPRRGRAHRHLAPLPPDLKFHRPRCPMGPRRPSPRRR